MPILCTNKYRGVPMPNDRVEGSVRDIKSLTKEQINDYGEMAFSIES